jgi:hypothetical protein
VDFDAALAQELKSIASLSKRVFPLTSPEKPASIKEPYLIYGSSEGVRSKAIGEGYLSGKSVRGELNVVAPRYGNMKSITAEVIDKLISMEQRVIGVDGPYIQEMTYSAPVELYEEAPGLYRCVIDFEVYYEG